VTNKDWLMDAVESYLTTVKQMLDSVDREAVWQVIHLLHAARLARRQVFVMGNGGSAATASHFACDLGKGARVEGRPAFRVISLTDNMAVFSAYANDEGYSAVFAQQLDGLVEAGDVVVGISGSGNSANVLNAIELARSRGATTIAFVGYDGGLLEGLVDCSVHIQKDCMEQVEDVHAVVAHLIATTLRGLAQEGEAGVCHNADAAG
jgi:D-sedoheptulose 7-phosphate isomerase